MIHQARVDELVATDPCVLPRGVLQRKSKRTRLPYEPEHVLALTTDSRLAPDRLVWNALAFYTGMREGEVCGRRWRDWDRAARPLGCLTVATQYNDQPLKTERHRDDKPRKVPVHPELAQILKAWWSEGFELVFARRPTADDFIVPNRDGEPHSRSSAYKAWRRSCGIVGIDNRSLHSTRHTFITIARRQGARKDVLERITHNAHGDIVDQYTHWDWAPLCEAVSCFRCDARCDARDFEAENKWRRWESNPSKRHFVNRRCCSSFVARVRESQGFRPNRMSSRVHRCLPESTRFLETHLERAPRPLLNRLTSTRAR